MGTQSFHGQATGLTPQNTQLLRAPGNLGLELDTLTVLFLYLSLSLSVRPSVRPSLSVSVHSDPVSKQPL